MAKSVMRAVRITRPGGPEVLEVGEVPLPEPGRSEIRIRVAASGLNRADLMQRRGLYPAPAGWPQDVPGLEYAGVVDAVGAGTELFRAGDVVMGIVGGGGYAEAVVANEREAVRVPNGLSPEMAGAIPEVFMTAYDALVRQAALGVGESVLIHAVGSGVGTAAVQLARAAGAKTIGTSRTAGKLTRAAQLGLDVGIEMDGRDWPALVKDATGGRGADVILDLVGAPYASGNLAALAEKGRWVVVGVPAGASGPFDFRALMGRRASVTGTVLRARATEEKMTLAREFEARVVPLFERGLLSPVVDRTYAPEHASEAHRSLEANESFGKLLLTWGR